jgi:N-acetylglucosaminyldiphosphoundecaprenol N-acetyl-beta-D-mannosaminyltransferase
LKFTVLGVQVHNATRKQAVRLLARSFCRREGRSQCAFFINAHTLNLAAADPTYRQVLNTADFVFADGTGVQWAAELQGVHVRENMVGTDFVPLLFDSTANRGYSYFMLGSDRKTVATAADYARGRFSGWTQAGCHHGYLTDSRLTRAVIDRINAAEPNVLLVGMGNPLQEQWIHQNLPWLDVPLCLGVGGLFDYWAGNVRRAPLWLRRVGHEWLWRLYQQPVLKARRYLVGNPLFLARAVRDAIRMAKPVA